jgi:hypothetical protein
MNFGQALSRIVPILQIAQHSVHASPSGGGRE